MMRGRDSGDTADCAPGEDSGCLAGEFPPEAGEDFVMSDGHGGDCGRAKAAPPARTSGKLKHFSFQSTLKVPPTVGGTRVTWALKNSGEHLDLTARDPDGINGHCRVKFEDIIAEPDPTVFSFDGVWTLSYKLFTSTKLWCYRITSLICAIPAAICWGIEFACLSFCTIWCWQPSLKAYEISLWYTRRLFEIFLAVFFEPCFHAMGKCLSHIVVTVKREG